MIRIGLAVTMGLALAACATTLRTDLPSRPSVAARTPYLPDSGPVSQYVQAIMVDGAIQMLGQPYRWGGAAPGGFDCSGLVEYAANGAGIHMPRTAHEQLRSGEPIVRAQVRAGDLVFMHLAHKELHVGIAIDGQRFIHAPSSGGYVRVDSLALPPYSQGFEAARRVVLAR